MFLLPAETAHTVSMRLLGFACSLPFLQKGIRMIFQPSDDPVLIGGIRFRHPVGLAAGFDKNARYLRALEALGFSHVEIGTVTPLPQSGNPTPRLFRLPKDLALINRMGFNNDGANAIAMRLNSWRAQHPNTSLIVGGNIGKNKQTPNELAWQDYLICFEQLHALVDYFTVNVSSPNTPGLRSLQEPEALKKILQTLQQANQQKENPKPILLKVAPDLEPEALDEVIDLAGSLKLDGLVLSNTTLSRNGLQTPESRIQMIGAGGLSGRPLTNRTAAWVKRANQRTAGQLPIIASGGIFTAADTERMKEAGASLVQVWTGFVYEGPSIVKKISRKK